MATNRVKLEDVIEEAKTALEAGNADRTITLCNHIFKYFPRCLEASRVLAEAYTEKRLLDEADQLLAFVLSADPQDVLGYADRGFIAFERGNIDDTIMYYERAIELDSSIEKLRDELLNLYRERSGGARARIRLTKSGLANARLQQGFYAQAIEEYSSILRDTTNRLDVQVGLLEAYWRNKDYPRAEKLALDLLEAHPDLVKAHLILWHIYGFRRHQDNAAQYIEKAHTLDPLNLIAERLFDDPVSSNDVLNYISMLGIPSVPPLPLSPATQSGQLLPDWAGNSAATDRVLGLRNDTAAETNDSSLGIDIFALLADTEAAVAEKKHEETEKQDRQEALAELDQFRSSVSGVSDVDAVFDFFEEVKTDAPEKDPNEDATAFDLNFGAVATSDFDLFNQIENDKNGDSTFPAVFNETNASGSKSVAPDLFDDVFGETEPDVLSSQPLGDAALPVFDLDALSKTENEVEKPPVFDLFGEEDTPASNDIPVAPANFDLLGAESFEAQNDLSAEKPPVFDLFEEDSNDATLRAETPVPFDLFADDSQAPTLKAESGFDNPPVFDLGAFESPADSPEVEQPFFLDVTPPEPAKTSQNFEPPAPEEILPPLGLFDDSPQPEANSGPFVIPSFDPEPAEPPRWEQPQEDFAIQGLPDFLAETLNAESIAPSASDVPHQPVFSVPSDDLPDFLFAQLGESSQPSADFAQPEPAPGSFNMKDLLSSVDNISIPENVDEPEIFSSSQNALYPYLVGAPLPQLESVDLAPWLAGLPLPQLETDFADQLGFLPDIPTPLVPATHADFALPDLPDLPNSNQAAFPANDLADFALPDLPDLSATSQPHSEFTLPDLPGLVSDSTQFALDDLPPISQVNPIGLAGLPPLPDLPETESPKQFSGDLDLPPLPDLHTEGESMADLAALPPLPALDLPVEDENKAVLDFALPPLPELEGSAEQNSDFNLDEFELPPLPSLEVSEATIPALPDLPDLANLTGEKFSDEAIANVLPDLPPLTLEEAQLSPLDLPDLPDFALEPAIAAENYAVLPEPIPTETTQASDFDLPDFLSEAASEAFQPESASVVSNELANTEAPSQQLANLPEVASTGAVSDFRSFTPLGKPARHVFHKRDERGPLPDFVLAGSSAAQVVQPGKTDLQDSSADSLISSSADETINPGPLPQQYQEQENDAMPIKRGPQDDNDVFDWEREELPDYLQAFAMDEDEVARSGLAAPNPAVSDVNTGPARMRPRDDVGSPGDLPTWLNPTGGLTPSQPRGEQVDLIGSPRPGSGSLPNWLDQTDLDAPGSKTGGGLPSFDPADDLGMDDLKPFGLADDGFGGPPPVRPTMNAGRPGSGVPGTPAPNAGLPTFGGMDAMDDLKPFGFDEPGGGFGTPPARSPQPPAMPPSRPTPPTPPANAGLPTFGGIPGMDDMDDLKPFGFDEPGGGFGGGIPSQPPSRPAAPPPVAPPSRPTQPPAPAANSGLPTFGGIPGMDDMDDLKPFSFDEPGGGFGGGLPTPPPVAPPSRPTPPSAPAPQPPTPSLGNFGGSAGGNKPNPAMPFGIPGESDFDFGADMDDLKPFSFDEPGGGFGGSQPTPSRPAAPAPAPSQPPARPTMPSLPQDSAPFGIPGRMAGGMPNQPVPSPFDPVGGGDFGDITPFDLGSDVFGGNPITTGKGNSRNVPNGLGFGAIDPLDTLSERPFQGSTRPSRAPEPRPEADAGPDAPLREFEWVKKLHNKQPNEASSGDESTFAKLRKKKQATSGDKPSQAAQMFKPQTTPLSGELDFKEVDVTEGGDIQPTQVAPIAKPQAPVSPRDAHPQTGPYTRPVPTKQPSKSAQSDIPLDAAAFDLGNWGLTNDLNDEGFDKSLDQTLPTSQKPSIEMPPFSSPVEPLEGLGVDPFDLDNIPEELEIGEGMAFPVETPSLRSQEPTFKPVQPQPEIEPDYNLAEFDLGLNPGLTPDFSLEPVFSPEVETNEFLDPANFDFDPVNTQPETPIAKSDFDFGLEEPAFNPASQPTDFLNFKVEEPPVFDFGQSSKPPTTKPETTAPSFEFRPVDEPAFELTPPPVEKPFFDPAQVATPPQPVAKPEPVQAKPIPQPEVSTPVVTTNGGAKPSGGLLNRSGQTGTLAGTLQLANRSFEQNDDNQAIIYFANAIKQADGEALDRIVVRLREIVAMPGKNPRYHRALGDAYKKQGQFQAALAEYSKALAPVKK